MDCKYRMFYAPSPRCIDLAAELGCNWVILHSAGLNEEASILDPATSRKKDMYPIYFEDYPKVARQRHALDASWLEPLRREVHGLCERAASKGLQAAFHVYEPTFPRLFESEYPGLVGVYHRPTQEGTLDMHCHVDPDNPRVWDLITSKYAEMARDFPEMKMVIVTTWDGAGSYLCIPKAKMPIHERLARLMQAVHKGIRSVRKDVVVVFRLWGRNWPAEIYRDGHRMIGELTGLPNAADLMQPVASAYNDPDEVLPKVFPALPPDVALMYKSTRMDVYSCSCQPLTTGLGKYPADREQILEVSYERVHENPWPWCVIRHIRTGLKAAHDWKLAGFLALPMNMGSDDRDADPERGNLGRMNTRLLKRHLDFPGKSNQELVSEWLEKEFGGAQPPEAVKALLEAETLDDQGIQWGHGVPPGVAFASPHTTKLCWMHVGFVDPEFPYRMANPTREFLEEMIALRATAYDRTCAMLKEIEGARGRMHAGLFKDLSDGLRTLAQTILLNRDWSAYLLMQYGIERGVYPADRLHLGRMSRYVEQFIINLRDLRDTDAGRRVMSRLSFPDPFPLS